MILVNRDMRAAVVLLSNTATGEVDALAEQIMRMLAGATVEPRKFDEPIDVPLETMQKYVGTYKLVPGIHFTVTVEDNQLMVGLTGQPTFSVFARSETEWFYKVVKATLTFEVDDDGTCNSLELFQNGVRQKAMRDE